MMSTDTNLKLKVMITKFIKCTNYITADRELEKFKAELRLKYGKWFKGSQLTDEEIDLLQKLKMQRKTFEITLNQYLERV